MSLSGTDQIQGDVIDAVRLIIKTNIPGYGGDNFSFDLVPQSDFGSTVAAWLSMLKLMAEKISENDLYDVDAGPADAQATVAKPLQNTVTLFVTKIEQS